MGKVENAEATGVEEGEGPKPMSKIASMKRNLSFGRLQKVFSREAKGEPQKDAGKVAEPSSGPSETDEKLKKAEEAMGEDEVKGENIESRVTGLKSSLMKMFTRDSEWEGATAPKTTENEGAEEREGVEEGSPGKMSSLKKRLSFKSKRSKLSKEEKEEIFVKDLFDRIVVMCDEENEECDEKKDGGEEKKESGEERKIVADETKKESEVSPKVEEDESDAEDGPTSPTLDVSVLPEELEQSDADADKQSEKVAAAQELLCGEKSQKEVELESESRNGEKEGE